MFLSQPCRVAQFYPCQGCPHQRCPHPHQGCPRQGDSVAPTSRVAPSDCPPELGLTAYSGIVHLYASSSLSMKGPAKVLPARFQTYRNKYMFIPHLAPARVAPARVAPTRVVSEVCPHQGCLRQGCPRRCPRQGCPVRLPPPGLPPPGLPARMPRVVPAIFHIFNLHFLSSNIPLRNSTNNKMAFFPFIISKDFHGKIFILDLYLLQIHFGFSSFSHPVSAVEACGPLTPLHIVPEWYFLCQDAMLKAVPNKNAGFIIFNPILLYEKSFNVILC